MKILNSKVVKDNLKLSSLFLTTYEMLKSSIEERIKEMLCWPLYYDEKINEYKYEISLDYKNQVSERVFPENNNNKDFHIFYSSCQWWKDKGVLNDEEINLINSIRKHRNKIAHKTIKFLIEEDNNIDVNLLLKSLELVKRIELWYLLNFEINNDLNGSEINLMATGKTAILNMLFDTVVNEITQYNSTRISQN